MAIDNLWMKADASGRQSSRVLKTKVILTIAILCIGGVLTVALNGVGSNATYYQSQGIVIDYGGYETEWYDADFNVESDPLALLRDACDELGYDLTVDEGTVTSVNGRSNTEGASWGLWYISHNSYDAVLSDTYGIDAADYSVIIWAYTGTGCSPSPAVDATATSIYGYAQASAVVTLSPVCTEIMGSINATNTVVGTDSYSNYPSRISEGHADGSIAIVGTYTDPSYESIMALSPSLVICDGAQQSHREMAQSARNSSVNAVVIYSGESIDVILDNIFIVGTAMGYGMASMKAIIELESAMLKLESLVAGTSPEGVMVALSSDPSPFVAGSGTYADDILTTMVGTNVFSDIGGWRNINSEYIKSGNPSVIIIVSDDPYYGEDNGSYERMLENLSPQWKSTDAYKNGRIYLLCEDLGELSQRYGPRFAQFAEIVGRILHEDSFTDGSPIPNCLGNSYLDYLTITKSLGWDT